MNEVFCLMAVEMGLVSTVVGESHFEVKGRVQVLALLVAKGYDFGAQTIEKVSRPVSSSFTQRCPRTPLCGDPRRSFVCCCRSYAATWLVVRRGVLWRGGVM